MVLVEYCTAVCGLPFAIRFRWRVVSVGKWISFLGVDFKLYVDLNTVLYVHLIAGHQCIGSDSILLYYCLNRKV